MPAPGPLLRADLAIIEQVYRGEQSFVVKDPRTQAYFRFRPIEARVMRLFDGVRSASAVAAELTAEGLRLSAATVDGFARKLLALGLLEATLQERTTQQLERLRSERRRRGSFVRGELLRMRFSFGDPSRLLNTLHPWTRWCFSRTFAITAVALFALYFAIIGTYRREYAEALTAWFSPGALTPSTLLLLVLSFGALTFVHEMGHAVACRHFGGEVREMGFMFLLFVPAFYANVTDAWSFPGRRERLWVTFAGPWIELLLTSVIAIIWLLVPPASMVAQLAVAAMFIGGLGNIVTNLNPLLPLDGYFALGDYLEIPNLRHRARGVASMWVRRRLLHSGEVELPLDARERRILLWYGVAAAVYSTGFLLLLGYSAVTLANRTLGAMVAGLLVLALLFLLRAPLRMLVAMSRTAHRASRARAWKRWYRPLTFAAIAVLLAALVPCSLTAVGTFTVTPRSTVAVTAPASGVVSTVFVREADDVALAAPVLRIEDDLLAQTFVNRSHVSQSLALQAERAQAAARSGEGQVLESEAAGAGAAAAETRRHLDALNVRAAASGVVTTSRPEQLVGKVVTLGDTLLMLSDLSQLDARLWIRGPGAAHVRPGQVVRLSSTANQGNAINGVIDAISTGAGDAGVLEARVRLDSTSGLRPGATGDARVVYRRATVLAAIAQAVRGWFRSDLLL